MDFFKKNVITIVEILKLLTPSRDSILPNNITQVLASSVESSDK